MILMNGLKQSGKSTSAAYLSEKLGLPQYAFAGPLKDILRPIFGWHKEHEEGSLKESVQCYQYHPLWAAVLHKQMFKWMGEKYNGFFPDGDCINIFNNMFKEVCIEPFEVLPGIVKVSPRQIYQLFGTEVAREYYEPFWLDIAHINCEKHNNRVIITDCRFENEAEWGKDRNGLILEIKGGKSKPATDGHSSEVPLDPKYINGTILNNGTLEELHSKLDIFVENNIEV